MSERPTNRRGGRRLLLGKCQVESVIIVVYGEGRHWKTEKGPRTSSDPLLPNPFSLPEMTERVKNNGSGRGGYDPLTRKRAENANERELREGGKAHPIPIQRS